MCDICNSEQETKTYKNPDGIEYELCKECQGAVEYQEYLSEISNTQEEMTR